MSLINTSDPLLNELVDELQTLDDTAKQELLRLARLHNFIAKNKHKKYATIPKGEKPPTLAQIVKWQHAARKQAKQ